MVFRGEWCSDDNQFSGSSSDDNFIIDIVENDDGDDSDDNLSNSSDSDSDDNEYVQQMFNNLDDDSDDSDEGNNAGDVQNDESQSGQRVSNDSDSDEFSNSDESTDDELIQNIITRQNAISSNPNSIKVNTVATDFSFDPNKNVLAVSDMIGNIILYNVDESSTKINQISVHSDNIRSLDYFTDGQRIASISSDTLCFCNVERKVVTKPDLNQSNMEFYTVKTLMNDLCCTGHENGIVALWDVRVKSHISSISISEETINAIHYSSNTGRIHLTTGYGELFVYDIRSFKKSKPLKQSEPYTSELTSVTTIRNERNIICGSSEGDLLMFDWEPFDYQTYKINNCRKEILSLVTATEHTVIAGYENGNITACHLYPNQPIGLVGTHNQWDVSKLELNHSGEILASLAEDEIKFWNISFLEDIESVISRNNERDKAKYALPSSQIMSRQEFFSDLNNDDT